MEGIRSGGRGGGVVRRPRSPTTSSLLPFPALAAAQQPLEVPPRRAGPLARAEPPPPAPLNPPNQQHLANETQI